MSTCISQAGEYSDHEPGDWCPRCGAFSEQSIVGERDALRATVATAVAELDKIEDRAPRDIDGMIYTIPWADGVVAGSKRVRRILTTEPSESTEGTGSSVIECEGCSSSLSVPDDARADWIEHHEDGSHTHHMFSARTPLLVTSTELKMLRETLCRLQAAPIDTDDSRRLQMLIDEIDRNRPLGPDGKHGELHTTTCGCEG